LLANAKTDDEAIAAIDPKANPVLNARPHRSRFNKVHLDFSAGVAVGRPKAAAIARPRTLEFTVPRVSRLQILADRTGRAV